MTLPTNRASRRQLERATARTRAAGSLEVAAMESELVRLRALRAGTYALMMELVRRAGGGPIEIARADWKAPPPGRRLKLEVDAATSDCRLWIEEGAEGSVDVPDGVDEALSAG